MIDSAVARLIREAAQSERYLTRLSDLLTALVAINTAPDHDLSASAAREKAFFDIIEREIEKATGGKAKVERPAIDPAIVDDPVYSPPGYAADPQGQLPPVERIYANRGNLVAHIPSGQGTDKAALILHAHGDVVSPWFGPRIQGNRIYGRGSCDNKAQVAIALAQLQLLGEIQDKLGHKPVKGYVIQIAIDEEIGGNGSLALAMDPRFAGLPVLMLESSDLVPYCAHRGAVYYRCQLSAGAQSQFSALEMFPLVVLELEAEGRRIKTETNSPLFGEKHVQTNHGAIGPFGKHPGNVCDYVAFEIMARSKANPERVGMKMLGFLDQALAEYIRLYGDKRKENDAATGRPKIDKHFDLKVIPTTTTQNFRIEVFGKSGHMAAVAECDNAITKAAFLLGALLRVAPNFPQIQASCRFLEGEINPRQIILEGGQGFTPSHPMAVVQARLTAAARKGAQKYCQLRRCQYDDSMVQMSFDRLHNDSYADSPDIAPMQALKTAFEAVGEPWPEPTAWQTSCDARIYHHKGHPVAIYGAGKLEAAHSNEEYIDLADMQKALTISTLALWSMIV